MKRIQIALEDDKYRLAKQALAGQGVSWQDWGVNAVETMLSESLDGFGVPLNEMAVDRSQFETKIQEKIVGALREQAFVFLAKKNGQTKWVEHKQNEVERLLLELTDVFDYESKGKWSKNKAARAAIEYYRPKLQTFVTKAGNQFLKYYGKPAKKMDSDSLIKELESLLDKAITELPKENMIYSR